MKKIILSIFLTALAFPGKAQTASGEERILMSIEIQLTEAIAQHKEGYLHNLFDDQYHGVTPSGTVVNKTKWLELLKSNNPYVIFSIDEVKASIFGNTAVVTGKLIGKSKSGSIIGQSRFIHVFIMHMDQWKIIEEQSTLVIQQ